MRTLLFPTLLALVVAGCATPRSSDDPSGATPAPPTTPTPSGQDGCGELTLDAVPETGPAALPRLFFANFTNCGDQTLQLAHACTRGMDIRLLVLYNSTDPSTATPPGVGPKVSYLIDDAIGNKPLACATAPPHVRDVGPGSTLGYTVAWSGLINDPRCYPAECAAPLAPGRYLLAANAEDATTGEAYLATRWLTLT